MSFSSQARSGLGARPRSTTSRRHVAQMAPGLPDQRDEPLCGPIVTLRRRHTHVAPLTTGHSPPARAAPAAPPLSWRRRPDAPGVDDRARPRTRRVPPCAELRIRTPGEATEQTGYAHDMAALGWLTPRRRSATARSVLAGEASAEAARKSSQERGARRTEPRPHRPRSRSSPSPATTRPPPSSTSTTPSCRAPRSSTSAAACTSGSSSRRRELARFAWQQAWFRLAGVEDPEHMQDARDSALSIVKGHRVSELMSIGEEIYDEYMAEPHLARHPRPRPGPPRRGPEGLAGHRGPRGDRDDHRPPPRPDRRARHRRRVGRRRLHRQAGRRAAARPGQGRGRTRPGRGGGPGPGPLRRVQRLAQRHPDALARRPSVRDQPGQPSSASTPANWTGGCATTARAARPRRSASRPRPGSARWRAARPPPSPCTAAAARPLQLAAHGRPRPY